MKMRIVLSLFLGLIFISVSRMEAEDQEAANSNYCEMVIGGFWPAYKDDVKCEVNNLVSK